MLTAYSKPTPHKKENPWVKPLLTGYVFYKFIEYVGCSISIFGLVLSNLSTYPYMMSINLGLSIIFASCLMLANAEKFSKKSMHTALTTIKEKTIKEILKKTLFSKQLFFGAATASGMVYPLLYLSNIDSSQLTSWHWFAIIFIVFLLGSLNSLTYHAYNDAEKKNLYEAITKSHPNQALSKQIQQSTQRQTIKTTPSAENKKPSSLPPAHDKKTENTSPKNATN